MWFKDDFFGGNEIVELKKKLNNFLGIYLRGKILVIEVFLISRWICFLRWKR